MNPKVSILIPIYKTSAFIEKCAHSLFGQTFSEIEYIFVDDASPDDSIIKLKRILEKYPNREKQVTIIHHEINKGLASSRNSALEASKGEYIAIVDSDDYIDLNMIEILYDKASELHADIVVSDLTIEYPNSTSLFYNTIELDKWTNYVNLLKQKKLSNTLCSKLIRKSLYTHSECRVPGGLNYMEDGYVLLRMFYFANIIVKVDHAFYHYVQYNENAITKTKNRMHFENVISFWNLLENFHYEHNELERFQQIIELPKVQNKVRLMIDTHSSALRKEYYNMFRDIEMKYLSHFRKGEILMILLVRYKLFWLAQLFHNLLIFKNKRHLNRKMYN